MLQRVTRAQHIFSGKPRLQQAWVHWFHSEASLDLFLDCFWWFFLDQFHQGKEDQESSKAALFDRIAQSYITLLSRPELGNHRETVFKVCLHASGNLTTQTCCSKIHRCTSSQHRSPHAQFCSCCTICILLLLPHPLSSTQMPWLRQCTVPSSNASPSPGGNLMLSSKVTSATPSPCGWLGHVPCREDGSSGTTEPWTLPRSSC